jgi:hypothetical protein
MIFLWRCWSNVYVTNVKGLFPVLVAQKRSKSRPAKKFTVNNLLCNTASIVEQNKTGMDNRKSRFKKKNFFVYNFRHPCYRFTRVVVPSSPICEPVKVPYFKINNAHLMHNAHFKLFDISFDV